MRIIIICVKTVPVLLVLAMAASASAQTSFPNGYSVNNDRQGNTARSSRFRLVPTPQKQSMNLAGQRADRRSPQLDRSNQFTQMQPASRAIASMPAQDRSTQPPNLNPTVDSSAFHSATFETQPASNPYHAPANAYINPADQFYGDGRALQTQPDQPQHMYQAPATLAYESTHVPMNRNFFGLTNEDCCCDEWNGFIPCGGLKAKPGHYGQPFIVGCDPCEPPCGRCSKCLVEHHRNKGGHCTKCNNGCGEGGCDSGSCDNGSQRRSHGNHSWGFKPRETKNPDCGCAACTANKGGLLNLFK